MAAKHHRAPIPRPANVPGDMAAMMQIADDATRAVLTDPKVWDEERRRDDAAYLPWPIAEPKDGYQQWLRLLAIACVQNVISAMLESEGLQAGDMPAKVRDAMPALPEFQPVLWVCKRAVDAADRAIRRRFGGDKAGYLTGKRDFLNWLKKAQIERLLGPDVSVAQAAAMIGLSTAAAYRALNRKPPR